MTFNGCTPGLKDMARPNTKWSASGLPSWSAERHINSRVQTAFDARPNETGLEGAEHPFPHHFAESPPPLSRFFTLKRRSTGI